MAGIDLGDAWADGVWEDGVWADGVWEGQDDAGGTDTDVDPPHFRDAQYRRRLSWGMGCVLLLLMAGCIQPPRRAVYDCLRPDVGNPLPDRVPCR